MTAARRLRSSLRQAVAPLSLTGLRESSLRLGVAVCYHRLGDLSGNPRTELVPAMGTGVFRSQLRALDRWFRPVLASELHGAVRRRRRGELLPVAITFDDDLASHRALALPCLDAIGVPATFFLTGAHLDGPVWFWWEALDELVRRGLAVTELAPHVVPHRCHQRVTDIHQLAAIVESMSPGERDAVAGKLAALAGAPPADLGLREDDVAALARSGHEIGFHTLRHDALTTMPRAQLDHALSEGCRRLARVAGRRVTALAYPHGRFDAEVISAARRTGWTAAFTTRPEAVLAGVEPMAQGRVDAPLRDHAELPGAIAAAVVEVARRRHGA